MNASDVYIIKLDNSLYPKIPPFHPKDSFPEYKIGVFSEEENYIYTAFRNILKLMKLDDENYGSENWNPFKQFITLGDTVLIKPNLVIDRIKDQEALTTHGSIIRAIVDYTIIALKGKGKIIIGDAPLQQCNFNHLVQYNGLKSIVKFYQSKGIDITLIDFRTEKLISQLKTFKILHKTPRIVKLKGDPLGYTIVDLEHHSNLDSISKNKGFEKFRVTNYDPNQMKEHHNQNHHKYLISNSLIKSDVVIFVPKIKSHRKAGITACLKNTIGINGHKDWLPHHMTGSLVEGGDEYLKPNFFKKVIVKLHELNDLFVIKKPQLRFLLYYPMVLLNGLFYYFSIFKDKTKYFSGSWYGNDTIWRTVADLNQIVAYCDKQGIIKDTLQRKRLYFCDGIISGESEGPLDPSPNKAKIIVAGTDPVMVDLTITELINFDFRKIPQLRELLKITNSKITNFSPNDLLIHSNYDRWNDKEIDQLEKILKFEPPMGWKGHIEKI